ALSSGIARAAPHSQSTGPRLIDLLLVRVLVRHRAERNARVGDEDLSGTSRSCLGYRHARWIGKYPRPRYPYVDRVCHPSLPSLLAFKPSGYSRPEVDIHGTDGAVCKYPRS